MNIAVFCGSGSGNNKEICKEAGLLGNWIGRNDHTLIYGGGESGIMGIVAKSAKEAGAHVIGVIPSDVDFIKNRPQPYCNETIFTKDMSARKQKMMALADAFIALPGGIGTIDEISETITLTKIGVFNKKSILFNIQGFYDSFKNLLEEMNKTEFLKEEEIKHVLFSDNLEEIENFLVK